MIDHAGLQRFVLIVGNARSGSTLLGALIDAHPHALVANETGASANFWRGLDRQSILDEIDRNARANRDAGRPSEGYGYLVGKAVAAEPEIRLMGDKVWNPATLLLHGDHRLLGWLADTLGVPVYVVHAVRNPFDVIATMHMRSGAPVRDRIAWYFMHCDAVQAIRRHDRIAGYRDVHHEGLLAQPDANITALCEFLGLERDGDHIAACRGLLFDKPRETRHEIVWRPEEVRQVVEGMARHDFLARYADDEYSGLLGRPG